LYRQLDSIDEAMKQGCEETITIYVAHDLEFLIWRNLPDMGDPGVAPFGLLMVHGRGTQVSRDLPMSAP